MLTTHKVLTTQKKGVVAFLLMAFGATWAYLFTVRFALSLSAVNPLVQLPVGFAPAIAALVDRPVPEGQRTG